MARPPRPEAPDRVAVLAEIARVLRTEVPGGGPVRAAEALAARAELDSLGRMVLAVALEDRFRVVLRESDAAGLVTFGDLADLVVRRARRGGDAPRGRASDPASEAEP